MASYRGPLIGWMSEKPAEIRRNSMDDVEFATLKTQASMLSTRPANAPEARSAEALKVIAQALVAILGEIRSRK